MQPVNDKICPNCTVPLFRFPFRGVRLDGCRLCGGTWFENGDLETVATTSKSALYALEERIKPMGVVGRESERTQTLCPGCTALMRPWQLMVDGTFRFDRCEQCGGVWADDGELGALAEWLGHQTALDDFSLFGDSLPLLTDNRGPQAAARTRKLLTALSVAYWLDNVGAA